MIAELVLVFEFEAVGQVTGLPSIHRALVDILLTVSMVLLLIGVQKEEHKELDPDLDD